MKHAITITGTIGLMLLPSCARVTLEGGDKPIHIVHDINIRVDRQLDEFFSFEEKALTAPATQPAAPTGTTQTSRNANNIRSES